MRRAFVPLLFASIVFACGPDAPTTTPPNAPTQTPPSAPPASASAGATAPASTPEKVSVDSPRKTASGATFTVPAGFTIDATDARIILTGPESDLRVVLVESNAANAEEAVASAWRVIHPDFKRPVRVTKTRPARNGWSEQRDFEYETSPNEKLDVRAWVRRHDKIWTVVLLESGLSSFEKRLSALMLLHDSPRPAGFVKESFTGKTAHKLDADRVAQITGAMDRARDAAGLPGIAMSLVQDGKVVYQGGVGVRELGKPAKIDADTLFMIASDTKALTTLLIAEEVDDGKFSWDTPVTKVYPAFKLGDADTTSRVLMKHLICACTGLPPRDLEWFFQFKDATPKTEMDRIATFQPTTKFGETFQYSNMMATAAGFVAGYASNPKKELGAAYDEAMNARVFGPLGMSATTFDFARAMRANHASPHGENNAGKQSVAALDIEYAVVPIRPAGGAWSSAQDLGRYVQMELANGKLPNGKRLVSEDALLARRVPQITFGEHTTYGMGLAVDTEYGIPVVYHGGGMVGFKSHMFWLPEQGVGGVILTNADVGANFMKPFIRKTLEVLFDGNPEAEEDLASNIATWKAAREKESARRVVPPDSAVTAKLANHYVNTTLGDITVSTKGDARIFDFGEWKCTVASRKNDDGTTSMVCIDPGLDDTEFVIGEREGKRTLMTWERQHEYTFVEGK